MGDVRQKDPWWECLNQAGKTVKNRISTRSFFFLPHYRIFQIDRVEIEFEKRFTVKPFRSEGVKFPGSRKVKRLDRRLDVKTSRQHRSSLPKGTWHGSIKVLGYRIL